MICHRLSDWRMNKKRMHSVDLDILFFVEDTMEWADEHDVD